jgi:1,4-dihydroxy-6-naphthoate synthase
MMRRAAAAPRTSEARPAMKLTLGFSPCPNDTFIFDALVNGKLDTGDLSFDAVLEDVQTLNEWAMEGRLDVSKISYGVLPLVLERYAVLASGGALGQGVGPLLVSRQGRQVYHPETMTVAIPGRNTTAHLLFSLAYPHAAHKRFLVFDEIEDAVIDGAVDAGVIIHEGRFTYRARGLKKLQDLGEYWEQRTHSPIPLGGIVVRRELDPALQRRIEALIRQSVDHAFARYPAIDDYVKRHAQEMDEAVMRQHVDLYVNAFSLELGERGRRAVETLLEVWSQANAGAPAIRRDVFAATGEAR